MDTMNLILTNAYRTNCSFAGFSSFRSALIKYGFLNSNENIEELLFNLSNTTKEESFDDKAYKLVLARDVKKIINNFHNIDLNLSEDELLLTKNKYTGLLYKLNVNAVSPDFFIVDKFPAPFDNNDWSAFCPDSEDEKKYGIKKGIYFLKKHIRPYYSEILLAHEMIHFICGQKNPELFAMGLEEGLAEILGSLFLAGTILGIDIVKNNFLYTRFNRKANLLWSLYADHTRQAYSLYKQFGYEALIHLLNAGRLEIHNTEKKLFSQETINWNLCSKTFFDDSINQLFDYLMLNYTPNYVVTPLQMVLIENAYEGESLCNISERTELPLSIVKEELKSIAYNTSLFMLDGEKIGYSNIELYRNNGICNPVIRYYKDV